MTTWTLGLPGNAAARSLSSVGCGSLLDNSRAVAALLPSGCWFRLSLCVSLLLGISLLLLFLMRIQALNRPKILGDKLVSNSAIQHPNWPPDGDPLLIRNPWIY